MEVNDALGRWRRPFFRCHQRRVWVIVSSLTLNPPSPIGESKTDEKAGKANQREESKDDEPESTGE